jgi:hypothetical protein
MGWLFRSVARALAAIFATVLLLFGVGVFVYAVGSTYSASPTDAPRERAAPAIYAPLPPEVPRLKLGTLDSSYGLLKGNLTIINDNKKAIKDVVVACDVIAASGTTIREYHFTIYQIVKANKSKLITGYNFGFWPQQGKSVSCRSISTQWG